MKRPSNDQESFLIDTYKRGETGMYQPGAITFKGRRKADVIHWKEKDFETQDEADTFVKNYFQKRGIPQADNAALLSMTNRRWY